jgi:hypothetical protein
MARTALLTLLASLLLASPASAAFLAQAKNYDWPPTTDFQLTSDPCAAGDCAFTARITFRYRGEVVGRIPLHSPARDGGNWDTKRYGYVETTNYAQYFWNCDSPGKHTWTAKIWQVAQNGERTDHPAESGTWKQPGCSDGTPRRVTRAEADATAREKVGFGDRVIERASCKRGRDASRWKCDVRWTNATRTCTDRQALFFYTRKIFHRRFNRVSSFRESRTCTPAG